MKKPRRRKANATGRNDTEQYVPIPYTMARSSAWRNLSGPAVKVWVELRSRFNGRNNGDLSLGLNEGARLLGLGKSTVHRALQELADKGFITMTRQGRWYGRMATTWAVTDRHHKGHLPTRAWRDWRPPTATRKTVSRSRRGTYRTPICPT